MDNFLGNKNIIRDLPTFNETRLVLIILREMILDKILFEKFLKLIGLCFEKQSGEIPLGYRAKHACV